MKQLSDKRQTALNLITCLAAFIINAGINFFLTPYFVNQLGTESYGFIGLANDIVNYANILAMALNVMSSRFVSIEYHKGNKTKAEGYISSILTANLILSFLVFAAGSLVVWKLEYIINIPPYLMSDVKLTFALVFINYMLSIIISIFNCAPFVKNKINLTYTRDIIASIIKLIATVLLLTIFDVRIFFVSITSIACTLYLALANGIIFRKLLPEVKISVKKFNWPYILEILSSGIWMSLLSLSNLLLSGLNSFLTNRFISTIATGYLSVARSIPSYIAQLGQQLGSSFSPKMTVLYSQGKMDELIEHVKKAVKIMGLIMTVPIAGFMIFGTDFYTLWMPKYTPDEVQIVQTVSVINTIPYIFNAYCYPIIQINNVTNKVRTPVIVTFLTGLLNIVIILPFGLANKLSLVTLCVFSTVFMSARLLIFQPIYAAKILNKKTAFCFYKIIVKNCVVFGLTTVLLFYLRKLFTITGWSSFFLAALVSGAAAYVFVFFILLNKNEYKDILSLVKKKLLFIQKPPLS